LFLTAKNIRRTPETFIALMLGVAPVAPVMMPVKPVGVETAVHDHSVMLEAPAPGAEAVPLSMIGPCGRSAYSITAGAEPALARGGIGRKLPSMAG
jgi:hypothetical protein